MSECFSKVLYIFGLLISLEISFYKVTKTVFYHNNSFFMIHFINFRHSLPIIMVVKGKKKKKVKVLLSSMFSTPHDQWLEMGTYLVLDYIHCRKTISEFLDKYDFFVVSNGKCKYRWRLYCYHYPRFIWRISSHFG